MQVYINPMKVATLLEIAIRKFAENLDRHEENCVQVLPPMLLPQLMKYLSAYQLLKHETCFQTAGFSSDCVWECHLRKRWPLMHQQRMPVLGQRRRSSRQRYMEKHFHKLLEAVVVSRHGAALADSVDAAAAAAAAYDTVMAAEAKMHMCLHLDGLRHPVAMVTTNGASALSESVWKYAAHVTQLILRSSQCTCVLQDHKLLERLCHVQLLEVHVLSDVHFSETCDLINSLMALGSLKTLSFLYGSVCEEWTFLKLLLRCVTGQNNTSCEDGQCLKSDFPESCHSVQGCEDGESDIDLYDEALQPPSGSRWCSLHSAKHHHVDFSCQKNIPDASAKPVSVCEDPSGSAALYGSLVEPLDAQVHVLTGLAFVGVNLSAGSLAEILRQAAHLERLAIKEMDMRCTGNYGTCVDLAVTIEDLVARSLKELCLQFTSVMMEEVLSRLLPALSHSKRVLEQLEIGDHLCPLEGINGLEQSLLGAHRGLLTELNVSGCFLTDDALVCLCWLLARDTCLKHLYLQDNCHPAGNDRHPETRIFEAVIEGGQLETFHFTTSRFPQPEISLVLKLVETLTSLKKLKLGNVFRPVVMKAEFVKLVLNHPNLQELDLAENGLGETQRKRRTQHVAEVHQEKPKESGELSMWPHAKSALRCQKDYPTEGGSVFDQTKNGFRTSCSLQIHDRSDGRVVNHSNDWNVWTSANRPRSNLCYAASWRCSVHECVGGIVEDPRLVLAIKKFKKIGIPVWHVFQFTSC